MKHKCIKPTCGNIYEDDEVDAYYCPSCNEQRKVIASEIDKKLAGNVNTESGGELKVYDSLPKVKGFVTAKSLGIQF